MSPPPLPGAASQLIPQPGSKRSNAWNLGRVALLSSLGCTGIIVLSVLVAIFAAIASSSSSAGSDKRDVPTHSADEAHRQLRSRRPVIAPPIEVKAANNVDERLFLLRLLNEANASWPDESLPPEQLQQELDNLRQQVTRLHGYIREQALDDQLTEAYGKLLQTIDAYTAYLVEIGQIKQQAASSGGNDAANSGGSALQNGVSMGSAVSSFGATTKQSIAAAGAAALGSYAWDRYHQGKARDAAQGEAINAARTKMRGTIGEYLASCRQTAADLTRKYGWKQGEAGFDEPADYDATWEKLVETDNADGLVQLEQTLQATRPRDPFVICAKARFLTMDRTASFTVQAATARECTAAVSMIPNSTIFDSYRAHLLETAALLFHVASNREAAGKGWGMDFSENAALLSRC